MEWALLLFAFGLACYVAGVLCRHWSRTWRQCVTLSATGWLWGGIALASPQEAIAHTLAHARGMDPKGLNPKAAYSIRYLDQTHNTVEERAEIFAALSFFHNSVSKQKFIARPQVFAGGSMLAVDLIAYGIDPKVWDRLQESDPYYHSKVIDPKTNQLSYTANAELYKRYQKDIDELYTRTYSYAPLLRADWFAFQVSVQAERKVGYYDFLGVGKKLADFQALGGITAGLAEKLHLQSGGAVKKSKVTHQNRVIVSEDRKYFYTLDFKTSVDRQNVISVLFGDNHPKLGDASRQYLQLANGLYAYGLFNGQGERQDSAPDNIAGDKDVGDSDTRVHIYLRCIACHKQGLQPVDDFFRKVYRVPDSPDDGRVIFNSPSEKKRQEFRDFYMSDLPGELNDSAARYAKAVKACNGLTPAENSAAVVKVFERYAYDVVPLDLAARELGLPEKALYSKLKTYASVTPEEEKARVVKLIHPVISGYLAKPPDPPRREQFEEIWIDLLRIVGGTP